MGNQMEIDVTVKNYRCFADEKPLRLALRDGFTGFLGANNAGKSSALRFFYEFRGLFQQLSNQDALIAAGRGNASFDYRSILDAAEVFHNRNNRGIEISLGMRPERSGQIRQVKITVPRPSNSFGFASVLTDNSSYQNFPAQGTRIIPTGFAVGESALGGLDLIAEAVPRLTNTLYVGSFRNAINVGSMGDYLDIQTGQAF